MYGVAVIKDVAAMAGLSVSVVSKYLKNPDSVRPDTRMRIEKAIRELHYVPSTQARALRTGKTGMISIISPNITNPFFAELFSAIQTRALERGYTAILQTLPTIQENADSVVSHPFAVSSSSRVDGMIVCFPDEEQVVSFLRKQWRHLPMVLLSWQTAEEANVNIVVDLENAIYETTKYLLANGHETIGYIGAPANSTTAREKHNGFLRAMGEAGKTVYPELIHYGAESSPETGYQATKAFWNNAVRPSAILTEADNIAVGCIKYCHRKHIDVPGELAVVGFDDIPLAAMYQPPVTTVRLPIDEMGVQAVDALHAILEGELAAGDTVVRYDTDLVIRRSTDREYTEII